MISVPDAGRLPIHPPRRRLVHERVDHVVREAVRVRGERRGGDDAHQLPVPRRRVLALRALPRAARRSRRARLPAGSPPSLLHVAEPECLQIGQIEPAHGPRHVGQRVRSLVAVVAGVGQLTGPGRRRRHDSRRRGTRDLPHVRAGCRRIRHAAILVLRLVDDVLSVLALCLFIVTHHRASRLAVSSSVVKSYSPASRRSRSARWTDPGVSRPCPKTSPGRLARDPTTPMSARRLFSDRP